MVDVVKRCKIEVEIARITQNPLNFNGKHAILGLFAILNSHYFFLLVIYLTRFYKYFYYMRFNLCINGNKRQFSSISSSETVNV